MSTEQLEKDPAPSAIRYLVLASAFTCFITAISFLQAQVGTSTHEEQFYQQAIVGFSLISVITMLEWFLLRRSRKMIGPYGFTLAIEIFKTILLNFATIEYMETISGASSPFFLHQMISLAIIFMLALTKVARTRIDQLAQKDISRNLLNLLPTLLIIALFMGTYITEIVGLATPRQRSRFEDYEKKNINWELYNTPTWDATYLLENLLDQFTAGLQNPYDALFNVSSDQTDETYPPAYWRIGSLTTYELHGTSSGTDVIGWWRYDPLGYRTLTPFEEGTPYSEEITESERTAQFRVQIPLDYSDEIVDVSVHNSFPNCLPTTWNGKSGSYVDAGSFNLYDASGSDLVIDSAKSREIYPSDYGNNFNDLLGIDAAVSITDDTSSEEGIFEYTMDYKNISDTIQAAATFSKSKDDYDSILSPSEWSDIQAIYLQLPNETGTLPSPCHVHESSTVTNNNNEYGVWAPWVVGNASECTVENQTVFSQALAEMQRLAPEYYINSQETIPGLQTGTISLPDSTGKLGLGFDFDMWLGNQNPLELMAHPADHEDYNEWFLYNGNGVSLHFASLFVTLMRLRDIPSRVVVGYLGGEASEDGSKRIITNMMLHAWAEVLIPIVEIIPGNPPSVDSRVEWVSFDPLLKFMSDILPIGTPIDVPVLSAVANTLLIDSDWDHQSYGPFNSLPAWNHTTVFDDSNDDQIHDGDQILNLQQTLNVSARLMMITSVTENEWMTWQPSCDYLDTEMSFYLDTSNQLTPAAVLMGTSSIDGSGLGSVSFDYDVFEHGDTVWFFAVVIFDEGTPLEYSIYARSDRYRIY